MLDARRLAEEGYPSVAIVRADTQTAGKGRIEGRRWLDAPGASLLMTLLLPAEKAIPEALPLRAGLGVLRAVKAATEQRFFLKWPNDLIVQRALAGTAPLGEPHDDPCEPQMQLAKVGGILCETASGRALVGIGINVRKAACAEVRRGLPAISLEELSPKIPDIFADLDRAALWVGSFVLEALMDPVWKSAYEHSMWGKGLRVRFIAGHPESGTHIEGILEGIEPDGRIRIRSGSDQESCSCYASGEISVLRPAKL